MDLDADPPVPLIAEEREAACRALMARHARIAPRGWDSIRARAMLHHEIDVVLDEWLALTTP